MFVSAVCLVCGSARFGEGSVITSSSESTELRLGLRKFKWAAATGPGGKASERSLARKLRGMKLNEDLEKEVEEEGGWCMQWAEEEEEDV